MKLPGSLVLAALVALAGCEKDGMPERSSGALRPPEAALLAHLPAGNALLFGGNYLRLQDFLRSSPFARLMGSVEQLSPGMTEWSRCFLDTSPDLDMMGAVAYGRDGLVMRYVMKGFDVAQLERCAARAGFTVRVDPDRAYAAIDMTGPLGTITAGYLALADGALLTRTVTQLPPTTLVPPPTTRADLEADVAAAARENATADATLVAELGRVDRRHAMWYVGDATGTPLADKVGRVRGWVDLDRGLAFELSVEVVDRAMADEIARGIPELKRQAGALGKEVGDVVRGLRFERKGDRLRFGLTISDRQLEALLDQMAPFMGGAGGMP